MELQINLFKDVASIDDLVNMLGDSGVSTDAVFVHECHKFLFG